MTPVHPKAKRGVDAYGARRTTVSRSVIAGCFVCNGGDAIWTSGNAQGVAARHHDATGHQTWADVSMSVTYGSEDAP